MNLLHLRLLCEVVNANLNISAAAKAMHTSQPGVSRHLLSLESELGVALFVRSKKRLLQLTASGEVVLERARRVLLELEHISNVGSAQGTQTRGKLVVAASNTYTRYVLPKVVRSFIDQYPNVALALRQGDPQQVVKWVSTGDVDIGLCTGFAPRPKNIMFFSCYKSGRVILAPSKHHPLLKFKKPTLAQLSQYPLISYEAPFTIRRRIEEAFEEEGLSPNFVLTATDVEVMKAYVKAGLGLAIVSSLAYHPEEDVNLVAIDARHLFESDLVSVALRKDTYKPSYIYDFIEMLSPSLKREKLQAQLFARSEV